MPGVSAAAGVRASPVKPNPEERASTDVRGRQASPRVYLKGPRPGSRRYGARHVFAQHNRLLVVAVSVGTRCAVAQGHENEGRQMLPGPCTSFAVAVAPPLRPLQCVAFASSFSPFPSMSSERSLVTSCCCLRANRH